MSKQRKVSVVGAIMLISLFLIVGCGGTKKDLTVATGSKSGTYYPIGGAIVDILNEEISGMNAKVESTDGSVENIGLLKDGKADLAIVQNDIVYYAAHGNEMYKNYKVSNLKAIASLYPETCQIVTLESSGIKRITELKGKRIAVDTRGSGGEANARQILAAFGLSYDDVNVKFLSIAEGAEALKAGEVDAFFLTAGYPTASVQDIALQNKIRLLPVIEEEADALIDRYPFYTKTIVPAGTYAGFNQDVITVSVMAMLVTTDKIDDKLGGQIAEDIFTNLDKLKAAHAVGRRITRENALKGMSLDMNAGAKNFFKE